MRKTIPLRALWKNYVSENDAYIMNFFLDTVDCSSDADDHLRSFESRIRSCPELYSQQGNGENSICWFAYSIPQCRVPADQWNNEWWFILELDPKTKDALALIKNGNRYITDYINIQDLIDNPNITVALFFEPLSIREIKRRFKDGEPLQNTKDDE